jgi:hypothetical protein
MAKNEAPRSRSPYDLNNATKISPSPNQATAPEGSNPYALSGRSSLATLTSPLVAKSPRQETED